MLVSDSIPALMVQERSLQRDAASFSEMLFSPIRAESSPSDAAPAAASAQASSLQQSPGTAIARRAVARQPEAASQQGTAQRTICGATPHAAAVAESPVASHKTPLHTPLASHVERLLHRLNMPQDMAAASPQLPSLSQEALEPQDGAFGALEGSSAAKDTQNPLFDSSAVAHGAAEEFASPAPHSSSPAQEALTQQTAALQQAQLSIECLQREVQDARDEARHSRLHVVMHHTAACITAARHRPHQASESVVCIAQSMETASMIAGCACA